MLGVRRRVRLSICSAEVMKLCQMSAGKVPPRTGPPLKSVRHRDELFGIADPHGDRVLGVPADEPGVAVVGGGAGLAGGELADRGGASRCRTGAPSRASRSRSGRPPAGSIRRGRRRWLRSVRAPSGSGWLPAFDFLDADGLAVLGHRAADALAVVGDRLVGVGHVERRDADGEPADRHRRVGRERRGDAHPVGEQGDLVGADVEARLRRRSSCRRRRSRPTSGVRARVGAFVVVDDEAFGAVGGVDDEHLLLGGPHRVGGDAVLERGGEVEGLERRAGLALALGGEVEGVACRSCARRPSRAPRRSSFRSRPARRWALRSPR